MGKTETDKCNCGLKQTAEHLLFRCKYYNQDRPKLLRQAKSIQDILKENNGQKAIYDFLDTTGIATRKWYLGTEEDNQTEEQNPIETRETAGLPPNGRVTLPPTLTQRP